MLFTMCLCIFSRTFGVYFPMFWIWTLFGLADVLCVLSSSVMSSSCGPMDCSPPGSSVHGIFQARKLEWVAISFSRGSSWPRDRTYIFRVSCIAGGFLTRWVIREALLVWTIDWNKYSMELVLSLGLMRPCISLQVSWNSAPTVRTIQEDLLEDERRVEMNYPSWGHPRLFSPSWCTTDH